MRLYQKYLVVILMILLSMIIYFYIQNKQDFVNRIDVVLVNLLQKQIEQEKAKAFAFSFALAQNEKLQQAIQDNDSIKATEILKRYAKTLEIFSGSFVRAQIVTKDLVIFARNWMEESVGVRLNDYRPDLQDILKTHKPHLSFEAARRLVLIASIPIIKERKLIGFIEVIQKFESIKKYFENYDVDLLVLLDSKYKNQAVLLNKSPRIGHYIVANDDANVFHIKNIQKKGIKELDTHGMFKGENHYYFSHRIMNAGGENIGMFVLTLSKRKMDLFNSFEEELDTFFTYARKDLYYSAINNDPSLNIWDGFRNEDLLSLKKCAHLEDKIALTEKLRKDLQSYTKEELISLLLDTNSHKVSRGHIK